MASNSPSRNKTVAVFSASVVAAATVSGLVAYFNGDTYQAGTHEATTLSGATVTAGGGDVTISAGSATLPGILYRETAFAASGTYALKASTQNPALSGATLIGVNASCTTLATARNFDLVQRSDNSAQSGTLLKDQISLSRLVPFVYSGSVLGGHTPTTGFIFNDNYVSMVANTGAALPFSCTMRTWWRPI